WPARRQGNFSVAWFGDHATRPDRGYPRPWADPPHFSVNVSTSVTVAGEDGFAVFPCASWYVTQKVRGSAGRRPPTRSPLLTPPGVRFTAPRPSSWALAQT